MKFYEASQSSGRRFKEAVPMAFLKNPSQKVLHCRQKTFYPDLLIYCAKNSLVKGMNPQ
jgi:hypothetical protein